MENNIEVQTEKKDKGFTLVELLIVIVILGILATVTVFAVRGITNRGQTTACATERKVLNTAVEAYFAQFPTTQIATGTYTSAAATALSANATAVAVPAVTPAVTWSAGANPNATLVNAGLLKSAPTLYFVQPDGNLRVLSASCGTVGDAAA